MTRLPALVLLCCSLLSPACGDKDATACTQVGCGEGADTATFVIPEPAAGWAAEQEVTYRFFISWEDTEEICAGSPSTGIWCDGEHSAVDPGTAGDGASVALEALVLTTLPETVHLEIQREDETVVDQSFTLEPSVSYPNGPECPPACATWSGTVPGW